MASATDSPGEEGATSPEAATAVVERTDDEKARRRAESVERAALMAKLDPDIKMSVAKREITLAQALANAGLEIPEWLRTGASAPVDPPVPASDVDPSAPASVSADPKEAKRAEAQRKAALMQRLPSEMKLRVAKREVSLEDAMREAGIEPPGSG
jgi:hypothetical protein